MKTLALLLLLLQASLHAESLLDALPEDTLAAFVIQDVPALDAKRDASPLRHLPGLASIQSANPAAQTVLNALRDLHAQMDGECVIRLSNLEPFLTLRQTHLTQRATLWDDVDLSAENTEDFDAILEKQEQMRQAENEALRGTLSLQARIRDPEALTPVLDTLKEILPALHSHIQNNHLTLSFSETGIAQIQPDKKQPDAGHPAPANAAPAPGLTTTPDFLQAVAALGPRDTLFYLNLPAILRAITPFIETLRENNPTLDLAPLTAWLEPESILPFAVATHLTPEALTVSSHYGFRKETDLTRILFNATDLPAPAPDFVHKDIDQLFTLHWKPAQTLQTLQTDLSRIAPEIAVAFGFFKMTANVNLGFDLETQLLQTLGTGLTFISETDPAVIEQLAQLEDLSDPAALLALSQQHPTGGIHYLIGFELTDPETFHNSLNTLITKLTLAPMPEPVTDGELEKTFLFTHLTGLPAELRTRIAATTLGNHWILAIGDPDLLDRAHTARTQPAQRLWTQPRYIEAAAPADPAAHVLSYTSGRELQNALRQIETGAKWLSILTEEELTFTHTLPEAPLFQNSLGTSIRIDQRLLNQTRFPFTTPE